MCTPLSLALLACSSLLPSASACNASLGPVRNLRVGQREDWFKYTPSIPDQEEIRGQIRADFSTHLQLKDFESETYPYKAFYKANFGGDDKLDIDEDVGTVLREKFDLLWRKAYDSCRRAFDLAQERKSADVYLVALKDLLYTDLLDLQEEVEELTKQKLQPFDRQINLDGLDKMAKKILKLLTFDRKYWYWPETLAVNPQNPPAIHARRFDHHHQDIKAQRKGKKNKRQHRSGSINSTTRSSLILGLIGRN